MGLGTSEVQPRHHLATPRTVAFNSGINPRVIDDSSWLKLVWASLNLERKDLLSEIRSEAVALIEWRVRAAILIFPKPVPERRL